MSRIKERWRSISRKWRLAIVIVAVGVILLGVGGVYGSLAYFAANPSACGTCHVMDPYVESYYESDFLDNVHAEAEGPVKCKDCHIVALTKIVSEGIAFVTGNYELPLETRFYDQEFCLACHSFEDVRETTKNDWQDRGLQVDPHKNPHASPLVGSQPTKTDVYVLASFSFLEETEIYVECQSCHKAHRASENLCATCHSFGLGAPIPFR